MRVVSIKVRGARAMFSPPTLVPVIGGADFDAWMIGWLNIWEAPIKLDPNWNNGDYYGPGRQPPLRGLAEAWKIVTLHAMDRPALVAQARKAVEGQNPAGNINDQFAVEKFLEDRGCVGESLLGKLLPLFRHRERFRSL